MKRPPSRTPAVTESFACNRIDRPLLDVLRTIANFGLISSYVDQKPKPVSSGRRWLGWCARSGLTRCANWGFTFSGADMLIGTLGPTLSRFDFFEVGELSEDEWNTRSGEELW